METNTEARIKIWEYCENESRSNIIKNVSAYPVLRSWFITKSLVYRIYRNLTISNISQIRMNRKAPPKIDMNICVYIIFSYILFSPIELVMIRFGNQHNWWRINYLKSSVRYRINHILSRCGFHHGCIRWERKVSKYFLQSIFICTESAEISQNRRN